jgi:hypothetical protein
VAVVLQQVQQGLVDLLLAEQVEPGLLAHRVLMRQVLIRVLVVVAVALDLETAVAGHLE